MCRSLPPWGETFSALQQGVVDGLEGSEFTNIGTKVYETGMKNVALTNHFLGTCAVSISLKVWNKIPAAYQKIVAQEFAAGADHMVNLLKSQHASVVTALKSHGVKFNDVDRAAFTQTTVGLYSTLPGLTTKMYNAIQAELALIRKK